MSAKTVYVSIGNSDDKLTQKEWASFEREVDALFRMYAQNVYGSWRSLPDVEWQNACWCIDFASLSLKRSTRTELARLAVKYRQDSIAWAEAVTTFIAPGEAAPSLKNLIAPQSDANHPSSPPQSGSPTGGSK